MRYRAICLVVLLAACSAAPEPAPQVRELNMLNDSGVTGTVTLSSVGEARTLLEIDVAPAGHPDMPAHVHPGTCEDLVPQPMFPLENVLNGSSRTEIPISLTELQAQEVVSLNVHLSHHEMQVSVACAPLN